MGLFNMDRSGGRHRFGDKLEQSRPQALSLSRPDNLSIHKQHAVFSRRLQPKDPLCTHVYSFLCNVDLGELDLPKTMKMTFPSPEDLLNFELEISPDEGNSCGSS